MPDGSRRNENPRPEGPNGPDRPQGRPRNLSGFLLILLVLFIVYLVVQNQWGESNRITYPRLVELLAKGKVEKIDVERNKLQVVIQGESGRFKGPTVYRLALPQDFINAQLEELEELGNLGHAAASHSQVDTDRVLGLLERAKAKPAATEAPLVTRRFILRMDGTDALLVQMGEPPITEGMGERGGPDDVGHTGSLNAYLFKPTVLKDPDGGKEYSLTFNRLLELTNTSDANAKYGLPAVNEVTTDLAMGKGRIRFSEDAGLWETVLLSLLPWVLIIGFLWFFIFRQMRGGGVGGNVLAFGKSRAKVINREKTGVTFADVAGIEEAKDEVSEVVEFLKHPGRFARLGGRIPRGVLLVGPPGTGKTLLAKAIAGEADVPFFSICGSDFVEMFVGVGASRVRDLFKQARENSPCIIFLDEIDAVGRRRGAGLGGGHDEREQTLNAILVEMDGFESDTGIILIAATNRVDVLDPALLRPGRFDRAVHVDLPDVKGREAILRVHARKIRMHPSVDLSRIARATPGFSGAELEALVNEAAIQATLAHKDFVFEEDLEEARDRVRWGRAKQSRIMDEEEKKVTAYHEAGHTLAAILTPKSDPIHKVTIIPRGQALGATMYLPEKDQYSFTRHKAEDYLKICFGGRIAEELFFDDITSGAANDIKQATNIARRMVKEWGMSEKLGPISYSSGDENVFLGRDIVRETPHGERTAEEIDSEVRHIVEQAYSTCKELLSTHKSQLELIAENLLEYETLTKDEIDGLLAGETVEAVRERTASRRREMQENSAPEVPPLPERRPDPNPDMPPGLAGEGA